MKAKKLRRGDTIGIVSLSKGILGEKFVSHEKELAERRLENFGFKVKYMDNALKGFEYLNEHPEKRAEDLIQAFSDSEVKAIICAIGGDDTYRLTPYLFSDGRFMELVKKNPKIFLGFSDTTLNHLMLYKCGLNTFYGQSLLADIAELDTEMLPYSRKYFEKVFIDGSLDVIKSSELWYEERTDYSEAALGTPRIQHRETAGFELVNGSGKLRGKVLGGCLESFGDMLSETLHAEEAEIVSKYGIMPGLDEWKGKILLLETAECATPPKEFHKILLSMKKTGIFDAVSGIIAGKPQNEMYYEEYKTIYKDVIGSTELPIVYNVNVGHAAPRCIIPFGVELEVDAKQNEIRILEEILEA